MRNRLFQNLFLATASWVAACATLRSGQLVGSYESVPPGAEVNLTTEGKADWVHWGLFTASSLNRKAGAQPQVSDFRLLGNTNAFLAAYQYADNLSGYSWSDGSPALSITNSTTGVWAYNVTGGGGGFAIVLTGSGFEIMAPADLTPRILKIYVGAYDAQGKLQASLSDGSALDYAATPPRNIGNGPGWCFTLGYAADSPDQTLTIRWTMVLAGSLLQTPNVTLQAATLSLPPGFNPPSIALTSPMDPSAFAAPPVIPISASVTEVDAPVARVDFLANGQLLGSDPSSPYSWNWTNPPLGRHSVAARAVDTNNLSANSRPVEVFVHGNTGTQTGSTALPPSLADLSAEGPADWIHLGFETNILVNRKAVTDSRLGEVSFLGAAAPQRYADNYTSFTWTNGAPASESFGAATGVFLASDDSGFRLVAPADGQARRLLVYAGGYGASASFRAWLSDFSAEPFFDDSISNVFDNSYALYTVRYTAGSPGQSLIVEHRLKERFDGDYGNITLAAVALEGPVPMAVPVTLMNPRFSGGLFRFEVSTLPWFDYAAEFATSLNPANWQVLTSFPGTGYELSVADDVGAAQPHFYRVRVE